MVTGWLHTEISVRHRELNPDTVAHLSTKRARRRLTSLIEANALTTTPDHLQSVDLSTITTWHVYGRSPNENEK